MTAHRAPLPLFPASVVGSIPRPAFVRELVLADMPDELRQARLDAAVRYVVAMQEHAGLDVVTDGEWRRKSYIGVIAELAHGFQLSQRPDGRPWTVVTERLAPKAPGFIASEIAFARTLTDRHLKATLPSPALLGERLWEAERSSAAYPRRDDFVRDCVPILRRELGLVLAAGADIVQIDDPHLCLFVDPAVRARYDNPQAAADFAVDVVNELVDGLELPDGATLAVHLCRRAGARVRGEHRHSGGYRAIESQLHRLRVHHITMEFTDPDQGDLDVLARLPDRFEVGLGCVDVTPGRVDDPQTIVDRVRRALHHIDARRVTLNPDCGFAPGAGAVVGGDEVYRKLCNEVEAARILRAG